MRCLAVIAAVVFSAHAIAAVELNGIGRFVQLREVQFMGALYCEKPSTTAAELLAADRHQRMEIRVVKPRIFAKRFRQWWIDGVAINNRPAVLQHHIDNFSYFTNLFDFKLLRGDRIVIERVPGAGVEFLFNGQPIGRVEDADFFSLLLSSWIGEVSLSTDFRTALLAGGKVDAALQGEFASFTPAPQRPAVAVAANAEAAAGAVAQANVDITAAENAAVGGAVVEGGLVEGGLVEGGPVEGGPVEGSVVEAGVIEAPVAGGTLVEGVAGERVGVERDSVEGTVVAVAASVAPAATAAPRRSEKTAAAATLSLPRQAPVKASVPIAPALIAGGGTQQALKAAPGQGRAARQPAAQQPVRAAAGGLSAAALLRRQQYVNEALIWTNKHSRYPRRALATRQQGLVLLDVTLDRDGRVQAVTVVQESEHALLNKAAVRAVKKASPFPPPPAVDETFSLTVPISFKLVVDRPR
ncbi:TonB family protein [Exilibacterium tricleocarpae]|uniref:TonB family protein n=1 Tax=Exilibacterium tricleocarpae TaxID=2591008 RepID=A0A545TAI0_9GAMM|nr:TonB family protein [Exilibacterium tricleocarpae]TQV74220.1 TonB family protein [Exilibacterium tricleocarpae]